MADRAVRYHTGPTRVYANVGFWGKPHTKNIPKRRPSNVDNVYEDVDSAPGTPIQPSRQLKTNNRVSEIVLPEVLPDVDGRRRKKVRRCIICLIVSNIVCILLLLSAVVLFALKFSKYKLLTCRCIRDYISCNKCFEE